MIYEPTAHTPRRHIIRWKAEFRENYPTGKSNPLPDQTRIGHRHSKASWTPQFFN